MWTYRGVYEKGEVNIIDMWSRCPTWWDRGLRDDATEARIVTSDVSINVHGLIVKVKRPQADYQLYSPQMLDLVAAAQKPFNVYNRFTVENVSGIRV